MKKYGFLLIFLTVSLVFIFSDGEQEEIDYLLFLPNSGNQFVDEGKAKTQLDNMARYLRTKNLVADQIFVYGYAADVANEIDPAVLSRERALHVIGELQKRGIAREYFTTPVGYGSVNLWGNNINENTRSPNRRVRVLFEDRVITPQVVRDAQASQEAEPEISAFEIEEQEIFEQGYSSEPVITAPVIEAVRENEINQKTEPEEQREIVWWRYLIPLLLIPIYLLIRNKYKPKTKPKTKPAKPAAVKPVPVTKPDTIASAVSAAVADASPKTEPISVKPEPPAPKPEHVASTVPFASTAAPVAAALVRPEGGEPKYKHLTEEEIREQAFIIFNERGGEHGYHDQDWLNAISRLTAMYEAQGYIVIWP